MKKVFLGGTCNESTWRDELIPKLAIDFFNPVVEDWTEECMAREREERENCDICLYVITPLMAGAYSIAEVVDDSNKRPEKTVFFVQEEDKDETGLRLFTLGQLKSLNQVGEMVARNGGFYAKTYDELLAFLNG